MREALEETGYHFVPRFLVGIYSWRNESRDVTYLRFAFGGDIAGHEPDRRLDDGIVAARWLTPEEIQASADRHRSPLIVRCVEDFMAGRRYPLNLLTHYG